jgi:hypothetical protein
VSFVVIGQRYFWHPVPPAKNQRANGRSESRGSGINLHRKGAVVENEIDKKFKKTETMKTMLGMLIRCNPGKFDEIENEFKGISDSELKRMLYGEHDLKEVREEIDDIFDELRDTHKNLN